VETDEELNIFPRSTSSQQMNFAPHYVEFPNGLLLERLRLCSTTLWWCTSPAGRIRGAMIPLGISELTFLVSLSTTLACITFFSDGGDCFPCLGGTGVAFGSGRAGGPGFGIISLVFSFSFAPSYRMFPRSSFTFLRQPRSFISLRHDSKSRRFSWSSTLICRFSPRVTRRVGAAA
jgi:hypothetical protein